MSGRAGLVVARDVASALGDTFITWQTLSPEAQWARILPMLRSLPVERRMEAMGMTLAAPDDWHEMPTYKEAIRG